MQPQLQFPNKSHRKNIIYPADSTELAELMGIIFGDGGINNGWQLTISLNSIADKDYSLYVASLLKKLFSLNVAIRKRPNQNTLVLVCSSTSLIDFLVTKGAVKGNKIKAQIDIPSWIKQNSEYVKAFIKGAVDTDGCLFIHKHRIRGKTYSNLGFCFTSLSEPLINSIAEVFIQEEIKPHITQDGSRIYLYSQRSVLEYMNIFSSSNPRITDKLYNWRGV